MTRFAAAAATLWFVLLASHPAHAQSDRNLSETQCFPWQELRGGRCVTKPASSSPAVSVESSHCPGETRNLSGQCACPANTHPDPTGGSCLADAPPAPSSPVSNTPAPSPPLTKADDRIICDGGSVNAGACVCPAGFSLRSAGDGAAGGTCVKTNAENCLGGELTVSGACQCNAQVVMSGETYDLEFVRGKCVPKRCPVLTIAKDGKCVAATKSDSIEADTKAGAAPKVPNEEASDGDEHRYHCGAGMIRTRAGCVSAHRRHPGFAAPAGLGGYPGYVDRLYKFPGYPVQPQD